MTSTLAPEGDVFSANELTTSVEGDVFFPDSPGFEKERTAIWNLDTAGMPKVIVKCKTPKDVAATISFAKKTNIKVCVHTAGAHSSMAVVDDCAVVDLSLLRSVEVDEKNSTATVGGGATIGDVDRACKPHGLGLTMGHVHHTGVAGMVLNASSGIGFLSRTRGLCGSFLKRITLVMHDGSTKTIDKDDELLWAMPGAGANFGVAVEMVFDLIPISSPVFAGDIVKFGKDTGPGAMCCCFCLNSDKSKTELVVHTISFFQEASEECALFMVIAPKGPVVSRVCYIPKEEDMKKSKTEIEQEARKVFEPITSFGKVLSNKTKMMDYYDGLQKLGTFDSSYYYQKGALLEKIPHETLISIAEELCDLADNCPVSNMGSAVVFHQIGGKPLRNKSDRFASADIMSKAEWWVLAIVDWKRDDPDLRQRCVDWAKSIYKVIEPYASKDIGRKKDKWSVDYGDLYGSNTARLLDLKRKYDPDNFFCMNRNLVAE